MTEATLMVVYCAEESHADDRWIAAQFVYDDDAIEARAVGARWAPMTKIERPDGSEIRLSGRSRASLVGDRYVSQADWRKDKTVFDSGSRHRYNFECKRCGLALLRRGEDVDKAFDRLAAAGKSSISIRDLAAIVKK